jgi:hypothetical protein
MVRLCTDRRKPIHPTHLNQTHPVTPATRKRPHHCRPISQARRSRAGSGRRRLSGPPGYLLADPDVQYYPAPASAEAAPDVQYYLAPAPAEAAPDVRYYPAPVLQRYVVAPDVGYYEAPASAKAAPDVHIILRPLLPRLPLTSDTIQRPFFNVMWLLRTSDTMKRLLLPRLPPMSILSCARSYRGCP